MLSQTIDQKLRQIERVFDINPLLALQPDKKYIQKYYRANKLAYSLFHTKTGIIHMGISRTGSFNEDDLLEAARLVEKYIKSLGAKNVLELATGRGGTSVWLAKRYPKVTFHGLDLSPAQLAYAEHQAKKLPNYEPRQGDFHRLDTCADGSLDIVFIIEALCYSKDRTQVLSEARRVLRKDGVFIILDAYSKKPRSEMTEQERLACKLTELGMAVEEFTDYPSLLEIAKQHGFRVESSVEVSSFILPSLRRFERLARRYLKRPRTAKSISKLLPKELTYNAISGLLMPDLIEQGLASYWITVLRVEGN